MPILSLARFTIKSYLQERILLVVMLFGVILLVSSFVLSPLAVGAQQKIVIDVGLAAVSIFAIILIVLLGAGSFHQEKERGILRGLLAKPISRVEFVLGKYLGTLATVTLVILLMAGLHTAVMAISGARFTPNMLTAVYLTILEAAVVTALLTLFSSFSSPVLGSFFTIACVACGHFATGLLDFAERFGDALPRAAARIAYYILPNLELLNVRSEAVHNLPLPNGYVLAVTLYALLYAGVTLYLGTLVFRAREVS